MGLSVCGKVCLDFERDCMNSDLSGTKSYILFNSCATLHCLLGLAFVTSGCSPPNPEASPREGTDWPPARQWVGPLGWVLALVQSAKRSFSRAELMGWAEMGHLGSRQGAGVVNPARSLAGYPDQHSEGGKAHHLPGGAPNLGKDAGDNQRKERQILKLEEEGVLLGKSDWLKGQYKKDVGVGGGSSGARQGEHHVEGGSAFSSGCPPTPIQRHGC